MNQSPDRWFDRFMPATKADTNKILMKLSDLQAAVDAANAQITKATAEIVAEIAALQANLADVEIPAAAQASLDALKAKAQALDDLNPDAP